MAYSFGTPSVSSTVRQDGRTEFLVIISETECAATSEWSVSGLPSTGTITSYHAVKVSGTATTLQPMLSRTTAPASTQIGWIGQQASAAASVHDNTSTRYRNLTTLYGRSTPDAGTNNVITTEIVIVEGHF